MLYCSVDEAFDNSNNKKQDNESILSELSTLPESESDITSIESIEKHFDHKKFIRNFLRNLDDNGSRSISISSSNDDHLQNCKYCQLQIEYKLKQLDQKKHTVPIIEHTRENEIVAKTGLELKDFVIIGLVCILIILVVDFLFRLRR
jgi:hypothetical protein